MDKIQSSELIINSDGSIYHLKVPQGVLGETIITVGDPERVEMIRDNFLGKIHFESRNREFYTIVAEYKGKPLSIISTGIGTDNIDIVLNEIDALFNINFETRQINSEIKKLNFIRLGTSGSFSGKYELGEIVCSEIAYGCDALFSFYSHEDVRIGNYQGIDYYSAEASSELLSRFSMFQKATTMTMPGFYGPQNRKLRLVSRHDLSDILTALKIDNLEMETSGIYAMSKALGHQALSINALLANRKSGEFHPNPTKVVFEMIERSLDSLTTL